MLQEHILKLPTPRLLAYYKKHYYYNPFKDRYGKIKEEDIPAFFAHEDDARTLKTELAKREHVG